MKPGDVISNGDRVLIVISSNPPPPYCVMAVPEEVLMDCERHKCGINYNRAVFKSEEAWLNDGWQVVERPAVITSKGRSALS